MSILKVIYADLSHASKYAKKAANELDNYAAKMERGVARKISNISGGQSNRTSTALYETQLKIKELREKSDKLNNYANRIEQFQNNVKETDNKVAKRIKALSASFAKDNGFKIGKVSAFFQALAVNTVNSTSLGRWVKDAYNKVGDKINDWRTGIKHWFKTGGGKYVKDIIWSGIVLAGAIFTAFTVGSVFLAIVAGIAVFIAAFDLVMNIIYTFKAIDKIDKDPAWAYRYGKTDKLSDALRLNGHDKVASIVDIIDSSTSIILAGATLLKSSKDLALKSKAIKNFFGNSKSGLGKKFFVKVRKKPVFDLKNGLKAITTDKEFRKRLAANFQKDLKKDKRKFIRYLKNERNTVKQLGIKGMVKKTFKYTLNQYKEAYKKINNFDGTPKADILKGLLKDGKLSKQSTEFLKITNKIKFYKDNVENLLKGKIKNKYYDNIRKVIDNTGKVRGNIGNILAH